VKYIVTMQDEDGDEVCIAVEADCRDVAAQVAEADHLDCEVVSVKRAE
jgi:hypothetical protein